MILVLNINLNLFEIHNLISYCFVTDQAYIVSFVTNVLYNLHVILFIE